MSEGRERLAIKVVQPMRIYQRTLGMRFMSVAVFLLVIAVMGCDTASTSVEPSKKPDEVDTKKDPNGGKPQADSNYIIFGHFYALCLGESCIEAFKLTDSQLLEDTTDVYPYVREETDRKYVRLHDSLLIKVRGLLNEIPTELQTAESAQFGMPDAGDGGGYYLEWSRNGKKNFWVLDTYKPTNPVYFRPFVEKMEDALHMLAGW
jgi:hypothetical protein